MIDRDGVSRIAIILIVLSSSGVAVAHKGEHHETSAPPESESAENAKVVSAINDTYVKDIKPIFQKTCYDCHSSNTRYPWYSKIPGAKQLIESDIKEAKSHLDFTQDYPFKSHGTPKEDLEAIKASVEKGEMPPFRYSIMHPSTRLKSEEQEKIVKWVDESLDKLVKN